MLADRMARIAESENKPQPVRYSAVDDAYGSLSRIIGTAHQVPRVLTHARARQLPPQLLQLLRSSHEADPVAALVMGDFLGDMGTDATGGLIDAIRRYQQQAAALAGPYQRGTTPDAEAILRRQNRARHPAVLRGVDAFLGERRGWLTDLLELAATELDEHADYNEYRDNHTLDSLVSIYDALHALQQGFVVKPQMRPGMDDGTQSESHPALKRLRPGYQGVRSGATGQLDDIAGFLRRRALPFINRSDEG